MLALLLRLLPGLRLQTILASNWLSEFPRLLLGMIALLQPLLEQEDTSLL